MSDFRALADRIVTLCATSTRPCWWPGEPLAFLVFDTIASRVEGGGERHAHPLASESDGRNGGDRGWVGGRVAKRHAL
jgi:hypothetical protein